MVASKLPTVHSACIILLGHKELGAPFNFQPERKADLLKAFFLGLPLVEHCVVWLLQDGEMAGALTSVAVAAVRGKTPTLGGNHYLIESRGHGQATPL